MKTLKISHPSRTSLERRQGGCQRERDHQRHQPPRERPPALQTSLSWPEAHARCSFVRSVLLTWLRMHTTAARTLHWGTLRNAARAGGSVLLPPASDACASGMLNTLTAHFDRAHRVQTPAKAVKAYVMGAHLPPQWLTGRSPPRSAPAPHARQQSPPQ